MGGEAAPGAGLRERAGLADADRSTALQVSSFGQKLVFYFIYTYVVKRGFLDGWAGFSYAFYKAWYFHMIKLLIDELPATPGEASPAAVAGRLGKKRSK